MELKEKQKHMCLLITLHISVNSNLILIVFFGYPSVLSYEAICFSKMMSIAIVLQTLLRLVICIKRILKPKSQTDLRQSPQIMAILFRKHDKQQFTVFIIHSVSCLSLYLVNTMISKIRYGL